MTTKADPEYYYYANSEKVALSEEKDMVAVDGARVVEAGLATAEWERLRKAGRALLKGWWMIRAADLPSAVIGKLREMKAIQQVFKAQGAYIVAYPEIQLEESRSAKSAKLKNWLKNNQRSVKIIENKGANWLIEAKSGKGVDALNLANALTEEFGPELSQSRFVRVVKKPQ